MSYARRKGGKRKYQKIKPLGVYYMLMKHSDENHAVSANDIVSLLSSYSIEAERRSIYRDIEEINKFIIAIEEDLDMYSFDGIEIFDDEGYTTEDFELMKPIVYNSKKKGFFVQRRPFDFEEMYIIAQSICSSKFISEGQTNHIIQSICNLMSNPQSDEIQAQTYLYEKNKTTNPSVMANISAIMQAMRDCSEGNKHRPEKIKFDYMECAFDEQQQKLGLYSATTHVVSPYQLLINEGNIHLLAYNSNTKQIQSFPVDRMKNITLTGFPREGFEAFSMLDLRTYKPRVNASAISSTKEVVVVFEKQCMDSFFTYLDTDYAHYSIVDNSHIKVHATVTIDNQFYGWLLSMGDKAKLVSPFDEVESFKDYINSIQKMYV